MTNPIVHVEIPADNPETAGEFYKKVFGWNTDNSYPGYPMFSAEGGPGGGFVKAGNTAMGVNYKAGEVIVYLGVDDIDSKVREIESNGGRITTPKTEIPGMGWFAMFTDPSGNRLAVYQGSGQQQAG